MNVEVHILSVDNSEKTIEVNKIYMFIPTGCHT
jgi:hypothetical protein